MSGASSGMQFVLLWSDALIFLVTCVLSFAAYYASRHEHLRAPWIQIMRRPVAAGSAIVLLAFVLVGLMDSIHFRQADGEVVSSLDLVLTDMRTQVEKTYSAPFATHAFAKETITAEDGSVRRDYPRLEYGGAHLDKDKDRKRDIYRRLMLVFGLSLVVVVALFAFIVWLYSQKTFRRPEVIYRAMRSGKLIWPWRTVFLVLSLLMFISIFILEFSPYYHLLGTDKVGEDVLYQAIKSIRTGLIIGAITTLVMLPLAIFMGVAAGYFRGWVDDVIQYTYTTLNSIPGVLLIAAAVLMLQVYMDRNPEWFDSAEARSDARLLALCLILGMTSWTGLARLLRAETLKLREAAYVEAAVAFGLRSSTILLRHILPNVLHIVLITITLDFSALVLAEAVLTYVGVGVDPSMISWGNMINAARLEMAREPAVWWSLAGSFVFMLTLVLAANLFADAVRDAFDPRLKER